MALSSLPRPEVLVICARILDILKTPRHVRAVVAAACDSIHGPASLLRPDHPSHLYLLRKVRSTKPHELACYFYEISASIACQLSSRFKFHVLVK